VEGRRYPVSTRTSPRSYVLHAMFGRTLTIATAALLAAGLTAGVAAASPSRVRLLGEQIVPLNLPFQGTTTLKEGKPTGAKGTWSFAAGTGKLQGIKGKGTWHCSPAGDGWSCSGEGEYELAK